jgi:hypothetical protein
LPAAAPELKTVDNGNFLLAWGGISGLQYALPSTWQPCSLHGMNLTWMARVRPCRQPSRSAMLLRLVRCWNRIK